MCVYGRWPSSYKISVSDDIRDHKWLTAGIAENGYIKQNESVHYYFRDEILKKATNVTVQLHVNTGTA